MPYNKFSERLNQELDSIGVPSPMDERINVFSKLVKIPKFKAQSYINGLAMPDESTLKNLAEEFEVSVEWLSGKSEVKTDRNKN